MRYFQLKADWPGQFTRYARNAEGQRLKALVFSPGRITAVMDEDAKSLAADVKKGTLAEVTDDVASGKRGFDFANPGDAPQPQDFAPDSETDQDEVDTELETTGAPPPPVAEAATDVETPGVDSATAPPAAAPKPMTKAERRAAAKAAAGK